MTEAQKTTRIRDLAILGGTPAFSSPLHVGRPNVPSKTDLFARMSDIIDRRWLTNAGRYVSELEERLCALLGVRHCVMMCNGTVALEIAIRACGMSGEVLVPAFTFVATPHALEWQGIHPIFCDVEPLGHHIDCDEVESRITPATTGILAVHTWGRPAAIDRLEALATKHGLHLVFDAAHAFGCSHANEPIGRFGRCEVFSFHATKVFNTFEGGAVTTNDDDLAARMRLMKNFGFTGYDAVDYIGTNGKMCEPCAAMGLALLDEFDEVLRGTEATYRAYEAVLEALPGVRLLRYDGPERFNHHYVVLEIEADMTGLTRDQLHAILHAENVLARRYFYPGCHRMEPYKSTRDPDLLRLDTTDAVASRVLVLPAGAAVTEAEATRVADLVQFAISNAEEIVGLLPV